MKPPRDRKRKPSQRKAYADMRAATPAIEIEEVLVNAAKATEPLNGERLWLATPAVFAEIRRLFSCAPETERRPMLVRLVQDEGLRIAHDRSVKWDQTVRAGHRSHAQA